jgi:hypothetical protein
MAHPRLDFFGGGVGAVRSRVATRQLPRSSWPPSGPVSQICDLAAHSAVMPCVSFLTGLLDRQALRPDFGESHTRIRQAVIRICFECGEGTGPVGDAVIAHYLVLAVW